MAKKGSGDDNEALVDEQERGLKDKTLDVLTNKSARFLYLGVACIGIGLLIPMWFLYFYPLDVELPIYTRGSCMIGPQYRFPCLVGQANVTDRQCAMAGCCWYDQGNAADAPASCFHSLPASYTFKIDSAGKNDSDVLADLRAYSYADEAAGRDARTPYGTPQRPRLHARAWCPEQDHAVLELGEPTTVAESQIVTVDGELTVTSNIGDDWDFYAVVARNSSGRRLLDTRLGATIVSELFTELTLVPASTAVFGLGQAFHPNLQRQFDSPLRTALFSRPVLFSEGFHPFYVGLEPDGAAHGVYVETLAPLEAQLLPGPTVTLRLLAGRLRLHVFAGPTPALVSEQYTRLVGRPRMPPLWSLGFHMCRQDDAASFTDVLETMLNRTVPFESDCVDADALLPFGVEPGEEMEQAFRDGGEKLRQLGRRLTTVSWPQLPLHRQPLGEPQPELYEPYRQADEADLLLRNANDTDNFYGELHDAAGNRTWNVSYVDYANPDTLTWLKPLYDKLFDDYGVDGVFLMRNAPANDAPDDCEADALPFVPNVGESGTLSNGTVCMSARQGAADHLALHNVYGRAQTAAVRAAAGTGRPGLLLTSTATGPGSGAHGGQLAAGLTADWTSLKLALVQALELGLYGVPQSGYPVCGSRNSTHISAEDVDRFEALCLLWYQLVPYLPLAVSFYEAGHAPRNPPHLSEASLIQTMLQIRQRYVFAPYHFSLLAEAARTGAPPLRPLWYEFAEDNVTWAIDEQLLLGPALMVAPALEEKQLEVRLYLPGLCWYEYFQGYRPKVESGPGWVTLPVPSQQTLIYQRSGTVIFNQQPGQTMEEQRTIGNYSVTIALSCEGDYTASGSVYLPGNDTIEPQTVDLSVRNTNITITSNLDGRFCDFYHSNGYTSVLDQLKVFGIMKEVSNMTAVLTDHGGTQVHEFLTVSQSMKPPSLLIQGLVLDWCQYQTAEIVWW